MDEKRFNSEYEKVSDQLYTFLLRTVGDREQAADLLQEAAYRAYRSHRRFRGDSTFKTWIYRIAINTMKNHWARKQREGKWLTGEAGMDLETVPTPEQNLAGKEKIEALTKALMLLDEGYRVPFMLKHVDGLSYSEISGVLQIEETAARVRVHRARNALRKMLKGDQS